MKRIDTILFTGDDACLTLDVAELLLSHVFCKDSFRGVMFLDLETTGLRAGEGYVYLIGCLYPETDAFTGQISWKLTQFFGNGWGEELLLLKTFGAFVHSFDTLVTFHGSRFDVPFLKQCYTEYHLDFPLANLRCHELYGMMRPCRKLLPITHLRFSDFEAMCGLKRNEATAGGDLATLYTNYLEHRDEAVMQQLLLHNQDDLTHLYQMLPLLRYPFLLNGFCTLPSLRIMPSLTDIAPEDTERPTYITLRATLPYGLCEDISFINQAYTCTTLGNELICQLMLPLEPSTKYRYLSDYRNYYYIPSDGMVIHKSIASLVPTSQRTKATPENSRQPFTDYFVPLPGAKYGEEIFLEMGQEAPYHILYDTAKASIGYVRLRDAKRHADFFTKHLLQCILLLCMHEA